MTQIMAENEKIDPNSLEIWTHNLTKFYGKAENQVKAVKGIDIYMKKGVHGFLGPNGAGKTSTINMLIGLISITKGEAKIKSYNAGSIEVRKITGFLPQDPTLYGKMTGRKYLIHIARMNRIGKKNAVNKTQILLKKFNLIEAQDRKIETYSGGMKQKVALASALIGDPEILILDEPTSDLDPIGRNTLINDIKELSKEMSIFVSSHVLSEIEQMCDKITIINKGKIILTDTIENIKKMHSMSKNIYILDTNSNKKTLEKLNNQDFIEKIWIDDKDSKIHIVSGDSDIVEKKVPKIVIENDLTLKKFSQKEFSLQDIFLDIVNNNKDKNIKEDKNDDK